MEQSEKLTKKGTKNDGRSKLPEYKIWKGMRGRCYNLNNTKYYRYGARQIKVCKRWENFWNFYNDMGKKPEGMTLDRIDVNGNYEPINCRWASIKTQNNNRTTTVKVKIKGEVNSIKEWCDLYKISDKTVRDRIYRGWDIIEAIIIPARKGKYHGPRKTEC